MEKVLVIGAGFMGSGIAQVCAQSGRSVFLSDINSKALERALKEIERSLERIRGKGALAGPVSEVMGRLIPVVGLEGADQADWIIEAVPEEVDLKLELFKKIDLIALSGAILASNTSSIPITLLAQATQRPEKFLGLHFFGPVPIMGLVEVVKGEKTSDEVLEMGVSFVRSLGKRPVRVRRDIPGFVMNRIFTAAFREAVDLVERGIASPEDIDMGMREGYGWRAGPFEIADNAGIDTIELISKTMERLGEGHLGLKGTLIGRMAAEGLLGRKTGKGFYSYDARGKRIA